MKILQTLILTSLLLGLTQTASAEDGNADGHNKNQSGKSGWQKADTNKDGSVSHDEFMADSQAKAEKKFTKMDANGDGKIDASERKAAKKKHNSPKKPDA